MVHIKQTCWKLYVFVAFQSIRIMCHNSLLQTSNTFSSPFELCFFGEPRPLKCYFLPLPLLQSLASVGASCIAVFVHSKGKQNCSTVGKLHPKQSAKTSFTTVSAILRPPSQTKQQHNCDNTKKKGAICTPSHAG